MKINEIITDEQLDVAFGNANFGNTSKRDIVKFALLKSVCGYHNGFTAQSIIQELGLVSGRAKFTKMTAKGKEYLWYAFKESNF